MTPEALGAAEHWLHELRAVWASRFDRLEEYLADLQAQDPQTQEKPDDPNA